MKIDFLVSVLTFSCCKLCPLPLILGEPGSTDTSTSLLKAGMRPPPQPFFLTPNSSVSLPTHAMCSSPLITLVNLFWKHWAMHSRYSVTIAKESKRISSLHLPATLFLMQLNMLLAFLMQGHITDSHSICCPPRPPAPFLLNHFLSSWRPAGIGLLGYYVHSVGLSAYPFKTLSSFSQIIYSV